MIKDIAGYEGIYTIDESGNIYSYKRSKVKKLKHSINKNGYYCVKLCKDKTPKNFDVHRLVAQAFLPSFREDLKVDHLDKNKLNNSLDNLRMVTHQENSFNTSAKGYSWHKHVEKYIAYITLNRKIYNLGYFNTEVEARDAYLRAKEKLHIINDRSTF